MHRKKKRSMQGSYLVRGANKKEKELKDETVQKINQPFADNDASVRHRTAGIGCYDGQSDCRAAVL